MHHLLSTLALIALMPTMSVAASVEELQLIKLDTSYVSALQRQVEKSQSTGKLELVVPYIDEIQAIKTAKDPLPELIPPTVE